ncbi:MAG: FKBP-type peptidyl-prolyl cis-trans isomerase [Gemmatimonadota bacterium]
MTTTVFRASLLATATILLSSPPGIDGQERPPRAAVGDTVTLESGLVYVFTQHGDGPWPEEGDAMVIHGVGRFTDGEEFWNTRTDDTPWEYRFGVDPVIRGFAEGMTFVREGDRIEITMTPDLAYGSSEESDHDLAGSTLIFDYEILEVRPGGNEAR